MFVIGIDFGNDSCVVSVWRNGGIDIVTNDADLRYTPSMVAFGERKRVFGDAAKKQWSKNVSNTIFDFKSILSANLTKKWKFDLLRVTENPLDLSLTFDVTFSDEKFRFNPHQVLAMLFAKIRADVQAFMGMSERIISCVIAVPSYFNDHQRKSVLMAAGIAKLDCQFLIKETTAVAINYALYKKFPTPINVIFIDFGQSAIQVSACKFSETRLEMIEEASELIGGRDIDEMLADYFIDSSKIRGANKNSKIFSVQLLQDVEELKKKMSSSVQRLPLEFKQLMIGETVHMDRHEMEKICAPLFAKIEKVMRICLERSKLKINDIHSIEMVGGSSRIPIMERLVEKVFGKLPVVTMNREEAVARGCLLRSIISVKRKGYKVVEKSFIDTCDVDYSGMRDVVRVFQLHRFLKCDCRDSFDITEGQYIGYVDTEKKLVQCELEENKRRIARTNLEKFLAENMGSDGVLANCSAKVRNELYATKMLTDGSKDQYVDLLYYWTQKVEKLKKRKLMRQENEIERAKIVECAKLQDETSQCDADHAQVKKLTFSKRDEIRLIERVEKRTTESGSSYSEHSSLLRMHRKDFLTHHQELDQQHAKESQDTALATGQLSESQNLLYRPNRRRKKGIRWCCFL